jgi:hypothetical protein
MKRIYKYCIPVQDYYAFTTYKGFSILSLQIQDDNICMWAIVDISAPLIQIDLRMLGTGMSVSNVYPYYVGTVQQAGGMLVWHIFSKQVLDPWNPKHFQS